MAMVKKEAGVLERCLSRMQYANSSTGERVVAHW